VLYNPSVCDTGSKVGTVYINPSGGYCGAKGIPKTETTVVLKTAPRYKNPAKYGQRQVHNGIPVYELNSFAPTPNGGTYLIPSLGVEIEVEGPLAKRVIDTLSGSPRTVALASGPAPSVPSAWHTVSFAGLQFSVPAGWAIERTQVILVGRESFCLDEGVAFRGAAVGLFSMHSAPYRVCPLTPTSPRLPHDAVVVAAGSQTLSQDGMTVTFSKHCLTLHGLTACPGTSPAYSILVLKVTVAGSKPVYVSIGLAGNGMIARTILYSLRDVRAAQGAPTIASCKTSQVSVGFFGSGVGNPGETVTAIRLTDTSSSPCSLRGYPVVRFLSKGGAVMPVTVGHTTSFYGVLATVVLEPGKAASAGFLVTGYDFSATGGVSCPTATSMTVRLPKMTDWSTVATPLRLCRLAADVSPIVKGAKLAPLL